MIPARRDDIVENYHGTPVADPYRWLEDPTSPETVAFVEAQNAATARYLAESPQRAAIEARLTALWNYPKYSAPWKRGGRYFFFKNSGLQNQSVLYQQDALTGEPRTLLDPNTLSADGTAALSNTVFTRDGTLLAYGISRSGSDWQEIHIRDTRTGADAPDVIRWCRFSSVTWRHDNAGFYYNRFPEPETVAPEDYANYNRVYWHTLGTPQSDDPLVYERTDAKELAFDPHVTYDGAYLVLHVWHGTDPTNRLYYRPVESDSDFIRLLDAADARYEFIGNSGPIFYLLTDNDAPRGRIVALDIRQPERARWRELLPEQADVIDTVHLINHQFVVTYLHDAHHRVRRYTLDGAAAGEIALPTLGSVESITGKPDDTEMFLGFTSFLYPTSIYRYDFAGDALALFHGSEIAFDPSGYETTQVFATSKDGTRVPLFLTHKKGLLLDGTHPTLLYGYGGFNVNLTPSFAISRLVWLESGGVYAVANLRGGGEYGEDWHQAGMLARKQHVFDDFIAAAEWLIARGYTNSSRLAINGGSNGGLLVAACLVQRPDLFGAVVCQVPVIDMLRYHRFTVGRYWIGEYGNAEANPDDFRFLYAYSPLHNVTPGTAYPPTLITSADTDDRVAPAHAKKFAATLQPAQGGDAPILLRIETKAGHGAGKPTAKVIEEFSDIYAFLFRVFGMTLGEGILLS